MSHFDPVIIDGIKFDKGMCLYEFDAFREPEKTRFQKIGERIKAPMNEIPTPQMYWRGKYWPDLFIANQLDALTKEIQDAAPYHSELSRTPKNMWPDSMSLQDASMESHGTRFHAEFIVPMCRKITGRETNEVSAKYHRSLWLPLYWPETLREGKSLRTAFHYPRGGYAGAALDSAGTPANEKLLDERDHGANSFESAPITLTFLLAKPRHEFSVLFVVDPSPIYRITDMDVCAGIETEWHRWVVEHRGPLYQRTAMGFIPVIPHIADALEYQDCRSLRLPLPTIANVQRGWKPPKNINQQIWESYAPE